MKRDEWITRKDAWLRPTDGATITKTNPRGQTLYALRLPGAGRPEWFDDLKTAKAAAG
jgi:hypothetical protein